MEPTTQAPTIDAFDPLGRIAEHGKRPYDHDEPDISDIAIMCHWRNQYRDAWRGETPAQLRARRVLLRSDLALVEEHLANARAVLKEAEKLPIAVVKRDDAKATIARASARKARLDGMITAIWWLLCEASGRLTKGGYPQMLRVVHVDDEIDRALYIGRPHAARPSRPQRYGLEPRRIFGNPFVIGRDGDRATVIARYGAWILTRPELLEELPRARSHALECWCRHDGDREPGCHGDVLIDLLDRYEDDELRAMARKAGAR